MPAALSVAQSTRLRPSIQTISNGDWHMVRWPRDGPLQHGSAHRAVVTRRDTFTAGTALSTDPVSIAALSPHCTVYTNRTSGACMAVENSSCF